MVHSGLKESEYKIVTGVEPVFMTAHAVLQLNGKYLLQLRDNIPTISAPGQWSLFGGMINAGEVPIEAVRREISEELNIKPAGFQALWPLDYYDPFDRANIRTWFFSADVTSVWPEHRLQEGQAVKTFSYEELAQLTIPSVMRIAIDRFQSERGVK